MLTQRLLRGQDGRASPAPATWPSTPRRRLQQLGAKVVTVSDSNGYIYDPDGINARRRQADQGSRARPHQGVRRARLRAPSTTRAARACGPSRATSLCPAPPRTRLHRATSQEARGQRRARCVAEGANMPSTPEAIEVYCRRTACCSARPRLPTPAAWHVSGLEMSQNSLAPVLDLRRGRRQAQGHHGRNRRQLPGRRQGIRSRG